MKALQDRPLRQKITLVTMLITGVVMLLACAVLLAFESWTIRQRFTDELVVTGQMVASNVAVPAMFNDEEKAGQVLQGLTVIPQIMSADLRGNDGAFLAHFGIVEDRSDFPKEPDFESVQSHGTQVRLVQPVLRGGERQGTLYIWADFRSAYVGLLKFYGVILLIVLSASLMVSYFLAGWLQRLVTAPILRLAATARRIAEDKDYSVRAEKAGADETGMMTDAFNQMLTQIHAQDEALQKAEQDLREQLASLEREVGERKAAEEALRSSQVKLLETSRLAGMAEVATNVLHNVGNVLNSVNVSGNMLNERLRGSKISALAKAADLINQHRDDFSAFVSSDPRGKRVPELVSKISDALMEEHREMLAEVALITSHIGHIKEIVAMQQNYSRVGGVVEQLDVEDLVEDALRMNAATLARHGITVTHEYEKTPKVQVNRHKVLQILVNLMSNAKHAVDDSGREDKRMTVKIQNNGGSYVKVSVQDNGVGIAPENLTRIFAHGFTTKDSGHGFGLHSGALAAGEIGGTLQVHSDGPGTGATFTLELPITAPSSMALAS